MATSFEDLNLRPELVKACKRQGFREPLPIQSLVIPALMKGRDLIVEAKTGSGKTLAYGLPILNRDPEQLRYPETLIVVPTRELAQQIEAELVRTAGALPRSILALTGGASMDKQKARLDEGVQIVVGTVGRIQELLERRMIRLDRVRTFVLDEVDELIRGGFGETLGLLFGLVPHARQTLFFSATVPTEVESMVKKFSNKPERLQLTVARELPAELSHRVLFTAVADRIPDLVEFLRAKRPFQTVVFTGTRHEAEEVADAIGELGLETQYLHGELSPNKRKQLLEQVRSGELPVLVASDLAARGLDLPGVDLVVNYSLPPGTAAYLHRAGRTGRAGRPGVVLSMVIAQQKERYEKLKASFPFESVDVRRGRVVELKALTREERDLQYRKLPERETPRWNQKPKPLPERAEKPAKRFDQKGPPRKDEKPAKRFDQKGPKGQKGLPRKDEKPRSDGRPPKRFGRSEGPRKPGAGPRPSKPRRGR